MKNGITLEVGQFGWDLLLVHDDGRTLFVQSDWDFPGIAQAFGWSPCARCRRTCHGATDGTIDCPRRTASEHIEHARAWLAAHDGIRLPHDPGYFEPRPPAFNPDLIRALFLLATRHHSGQSSRGYRLLCHVQRYAARHAIDLDLSTYRSNRLYRRLCRRYADCL